MSDSKTEKPAEKPTEEKKEEKKEKSSNGIAKNILLSTIGTTISIILTFGTTSLVDKYQAAQSRKLFAMTIIHEIDQDIERVRQRAVEAAELHSLNQSIRNLSQFDNIPKDSLARFYDLLSPIREAVVDFSKSNEQIFNSTQNTWSTIDNNIFISNVQKYYQLRSQLEHSFKVDTCFNPILSSKEYSGKISYVNGHYITEDRDSIIKRLYKEKRPNWGVHMFCISLGRLKAYNQLLRYKSVNEENKILMGISEKELEDFANRTAEARNVSKKDMIGSWIAKSYDIKPFWDNQLHNIFTFHKDKTITVHGYGNGHSSMGLGDMVLYYNTKGNWKIENDSLVITFSDDDLDVKIDDNDFYCSNISQLHEVENKNFGTIFGEIGADLGAHFSPNQCNTITVNALIDRFDRSITLRTKHGKEPKRFERTDLSTIPTYDFVKHPATEQEVTGKWAWFEDANTIQMEFDHGKDHSLAIWKVYKGRRPDLFSGTLRVKRNLSGEWKLENDSLVYYYDTKTLDLSFDDSGITVVPGKENLLSEFKQQLIDFYTQRTLQTPREAFQAITNAKRMEMIDKDGNMMFLYK